jgi:hypothetical protein
MLRNGGTYLPARLVHLPWVRHCATRLIHRPRDFVGSSQERDGDRDPTCCRAVSGVLIWPGAEDRRLAGKAPREVSAARRLFMSELTPRVVIKSLLLGSKFLKRDGISDGIAHT